MKFDNTAFYAAAFLGFVFSVSACFFEYTTAADFAVYPILYFIIHNALMLNKINKKLDKDNNHGR